MSFGRWSFDASFCTEAEGRRVFEGCCLLAVGVARPDLSVEIGVLFGTLRALEAIVGAVSLEEVEVLAERGEDGALASEAVAMVADGVLEDVARGVALESLLALRDRVASGMTGGRADGQTNGRLFPRWCTRNHQ